MFDLNAIITNAITNAVNEAIQTAVGPLVLRIAALEAKLTEADLFTKTAEVTVPINEARLVEVLDQQEWFWEKLMRKAGEAAESAVEEALNDHCNEYDHDDYDNVSSTVNDVDLDNVVTHDNLRDEIQRVLREVTISIDV